MEIATDEIVWARNFLTNVVQTIDQNAVLSENPVLKEAKTLDIARYARQILNNNLPTGCLSYLRWMQLNRVGGICILVAMCLILFQNGVETYRIRQCHASIKAPPRLILISRLVFLVVSFFGGVSMAVFAYIGIKTQGVQFTEYDKAVVVIFWINSLVALVNLVSLVLFLINYVSTFHEPVKSIVC
jgi:hypothetical protein